MKKLLLMAVLLVCQLAVFAQDQPADTTVMKLNLDSLMGQQFQKAASLKFQTGTITLKDNLATLNVPAGFRYLDAAQSNMVLSELWGNPPNDSSLGMLFPENLGPLDSGSWAFNISYEASGYVKDDEANEINYDELLETMKENDKKANEQRAQAGYTTLNLVGWGAKPFYDEKNHTLHWAMEFQVPGDPVNTLNYNVRLLGRKGVLNLNAIASMPMLPEVSKHIDNVRNSVTFGEGQKYGDFNPDLDEVAAYGIGGLIAGKVLTKVGFFAVLLKFWKIIAGVIIAGGSFLWRLITGRSKEEEPVVATSEVGADSDESERKM